MPRGRKPKFTLEQEIAIARRYETGDESMSSIAETLGTTRALVGQILVRQGVKTRHHQHALTPSQEEEIVERFTNGQTARDMEELFGVDHTTINSIVRRRGGPLRRCGRPRKFESREDWLKSPYIRLRKLLQTARANALGKGRPFDNALFEIFPNNPPKVCACCNVELDYSVYPRTEMSHSRAPSFDRCDNALGYVVGNVYIICFRCNRLKNDASLQEILLLAEYARRHLAREQ